MPAVSFRLSLGACLVAASLFVRPQLVAADVHTVAPFACGTTGFAPVHSDLIWSPEENTDRAAGFFAKDIFKCYTKFADDAGRTACIEARRTPWLNGTLQIIWNVPDCHNRPQIFDDHIARFRAFAGQISKGQKKYAKAAGQLARRLVQLHMGYYVQLAQGECDDDFENVVEGHYATWIKNIKDPLPACLEATKDTFAKDMEHDIDAYNGTIFCANQSGTVGDATDQRYPQNRPSPSPTPAPTPTATP